MIKEKKEKANIQQEIIKAIQAYPKIVLSRHIRPDGDAVGSTFALKRIIELTWPEKKVYVINSDCSVLYKFLGEEDSQLDDYTDVLSIILDTSDTKRISNEKYNASACIIKIDHHPNCEEYGQIQWIEEDRSSVCEMIAQLREDNKNLLKTDAFVSTCLFMGICTDSGTFKYSNASAKTLKLAASLLEEGVQPQKIFSFLDLKDFEFLKFHSKALAHIDKTKNGVAYLYVDKKMKAKFNLSDEVFSSAVNFMECIKGCPLWILFIEENGRIRVRIRSRFIRLEKLAEKYSGGGHANACGATVYTKRQVKKLLYDADMLLKEEKLKANDLW